MPPVESLPYPSEVLPEVQRLYKMLTKQEPLDKKRLVKDLWLVSGYGCRFTLGDPDAFGALAVAGVSDEEHAVIAAQPELSPQQVVDILGVIAEDQPHAASLTGVVTAGFAGLGKNALLKLVVPYLMQWLSDWLSKGGLGDLLPAT